MRRALTALLLALLALAAGRPAAAAVLEVENRRPDAVRVALDGGPEFVVAARDELVVHARPGRHELRVRRARDGRVLLVRALELRAGRPVEVEVRELPGTLVVRSAASAAVELLVDGRSAGRIAPWSERSLSLAPGAHRVEARYVQFGRERRIVLGTIRVREGERERALLGEPATTLVRVVNDTGRGADLLVDGRFEHRLAPGEAALVEVRVGLRRLELRSRGRVLDAARIDARPFVERTWRAVAPPPRRGLVRLDNDTFVPVTVYADGRRVRRVAPWDDVVLELALGRTTIVVRDDRGRVLLARTIVVDDRRVARIEVEDDDDFVAEAGERGHRHHRRP